MISCRFFDFCILTQNPLAIFQAKIDIMHNNSKKGHVISGWFL